MKARHLSALIALLTFSFGFVPPAFADEPGREFTATAVVDDSQGTRRMPVTFVAHRFTTVEQAQNLAGILERAGQGGLLSALKGRNDGQLRLGALQMPISLVVAEPARRGYRYLFLTARRIRIEEQEFGEESLDYPFGIAVFEIDSLGRGEGSLHVAAALYIDADGHVEIEDYDGQDGSFEDLKQVR